MNWLNLIYVGIILLTILVILFGRLEDWKVYMLFILDMILLSSFSPYYYILYGIAPLLMFLDQKQKSGLLTVVYSILFAGIFMTFVSVKYPVAAFAPSQKIWSMTILTGTFLVLFEIVLLTEGIASCIGRWKDWRKANRPDGEGK